MPDLYPFQQEWMDDHSAIIAIEGNTSCGKTFVHIPWFVAHAHQPVNRGDEYWWVGPSINKAKEVFDDILRSLEEAGAVGDYKVNRTDRSIETPQGGIMVFKTGEKIGLLYGTRNTRLIVVDEFTRCRFGIWTPLKTVLDKTNCPIRFIGNFQGEDTEWHRWITTMSKLPGFKYYCTTALDVVAAGMRSQEWLDTARASMPEPIFNALYLCRGSSDTRMLVSYGAVADLWTNDHIPEGRKCITADIAMQGSDRFVMGVWSGFRLKEVTVHQGKDAKQLEDIIRGKATEHGVGRSDIVFDADGMGIYLKSYLNGARSYQGGTVSIEQQGQKLSYARLRDQCHFMTANLINERGIFIEQETHQEEISRELLASLRKLGQTPAGQWQVVPKDYNVPDPEDPNRRLIGSKQILGRSPDFSDMIVMRQYLELTPCPVMVDSLHEAAQKKRIKFAASKRTDTRHTPFTGR